MRSCIAFVLAALALAACAAPSRGFLMAYDVVVSSDFTPAQSETAIEAIGMWTAAEPELKLNVTIGACPVDGVLCVRPVRTTTSIAGTDNPIGLTSYGDAATADSKIYVDLIAQVAPWGFDPTTVLRQTIAHELGHAMMGPEHLACPGSLMCVQATEASPVLTALDLAHFASER